jgi:hypothetical protein
MSYESHKKVLRKALGHLKNPTVLELGLGEGSTLLIQKHSSYSVSLDHSEEWVNKYPSSDKHLVERVQAYSKEKWESKWFERKWDLIFVDNAPGESRGYLVNLLIDKCKVMICHDTEETVEAAGSNYGYNFSGIKYKYHYDKERPHTTVLSNVMDVKNIFE